MVVLFRFNPARKAYNRYLDGMGINEALDNRLNLHHGTVAYVDEHRKMPRWATWYWTKCNDHRDFPQGSLGFTKVTRREEVMALVPKKLTSKQALIFCWCFATQKWKKRITNELHKVLFQFTCNNISRKYADAIKDPTIKQAVYDIIDSQGTLPEIMSVFT